MKLLKSILLGIVFLIIIGLFSYSLWYQWKGNQKTAPERMQPHGPIAEFNHENRVRTVAISPKEPHYIVSVGDGKDIKIWDRDNQEKPVRVLTNHPIDDNDTAISINSVYFNSSGELLISKNFWMVAFWDVASWDLISSYRIPCSTGAVSPRENLLATCSLDIEIWDFTSPKDIKKIYQLNNNKNHYFYDSAKFSYNGRWLGKLISVRSSTSEINKKKVHIWDLNTKKLHRILGREVATDTTSSSKERKPVMVVSDRGIKESNLKVERNDIRTISFSPDNRFFVIGTDFGFTIWSLPEWKIYHNIDNVFIVDFAFSPNGDVFAIVSLNGIMIWSIDEMKPIAILKGSKRWTFYNKIAFSWDGKLLVGGGYDSIVNLWDMEAIE